MSMFSGNVDGASVVIVYGIGEYSAEHGDLATVDDACVVGIATEQRA